MRTGCTLRLVGLLVAGCTEAGGSRDDPELRAIKPRPSAQTLGEPCDVDGDCSAGEACFDAGDGPRCMCEGGLIGCVDRCVDASNDDENCGWCGAPCSPGLRCVDGTCQSSREFRTTALAPADVGTVQLLSRNDNTQCHDYGEPVVEKAGTGYGMFALYNYHWFNYGYAWNLWDVDSNQWAFPSAETGGDTIGDSWATASGLTRLSYAAQVLNTTPNYCIGVAATDSSHLPLDSWLDGGAKCITDRNTSGADGPAITYDPGAYNFWVVNSSPPDLYVFANCQSGRPGSSTCLKTAGPIDIRQGDNPGGPRLGFRDHGNVRVNPCTHHAVVAYRTPSEPPDTSDIKLRFYNTAGTRVADFTVHWNMYHNQNTWCPGSGVGCVGTNPPAHICKCTGRGSGDCGYDGGTSGCVRLASRVHLATHGIGGHCYAYLAYDVSNVYSGDGQTYMTAWLDVVDITNENSPYVVNYYASALNAGYNEYNSNVAVSGTNVAWFVTSQRYGDPCYTSQWVGLDANKALTGIGSWTMLAGYFPTINFGNGLGQGDYYQAAATAVANGYTFGVWEGAYPYVGSSPAWPCFQCRGTWYTSMIWGTRVRP